jgi:hypothetical protein
MLARRVVWKDFSLLSLGYPHADNLYEASKHMKPAPKLVLVLDVSGSMKPYMDDVKKASLAALELVGSLKIIAFDHEIVQVQQCSYKDEVSNAIVNRNGSTNIQDALTATLAEEDQTIVLMTDGLANTGSLTSSQSLLDYARSFPSYQKNVFHCLGFWRKDTCLNAELLKSLAFDTNGIFHLGSNSDCLASFIGDVLSDYYFRVNVNFRELPFGLLNEIPRCGFTIRADAPSHFVFLGCPPSNFTETTAEPSEQDIKEIFKVRVANALKQGKKEVDVLAKEMDAPFLLPLKLQMEVASKITVSEYENPDTIRRSELVHLISSREDSQDVIHLRQHTVNLSQCQ